MGAALLVGWIGVEVVSGWGVWIAAARYGADLPSRAGPTRDLLRGIRRAGNCPMVCG